MSGERLESSMPRRDDLHSILIIGSGRCDRAGMRIRLLRHAGVPVLKEEGYRVVLANSNPATIIDRTRTSPTPPTLSRLTWEVLASIIERERPM